MDMPPLDAPTAKILRDILTSRSISYGSLRDSLPAELRQKLPDIISWFVSMGMVFVSGRTDDSFEANFTQVTVNPAMASVVWQVVQQAAGQSNFLSSSSIASSGTGPSGLSVSDPSSLTFNKSR